MFLNDPMRFTVPHGTTLHHHSRQPHAAFDLPLADQWGIFAAQLQRFCQNRFKLPHINTIDDAVELLSKARKVLVLTGAGISVSCGIPDFRSGRGLYAIIAEKYPEVNGLAVVEQSLH